MTADFYDEAGRRARWLGALHGHPDPETLRGLGCGRLMLEATDPKTFADAVVDLIEVFPGEGLGAKPPSPRRLAVVMAGQPQHRLGLHLRPWSGVGHHRLHLELRDAPR